MMMYGVDCYEKAMFTLCSYIASQQFLFLAIIAIVLYTKQTLNIISLFFWNII